MACLPNTHARTNACTASISNVLTDNITRQHHTSIAAAVFFLRVVQVDYTTSGLRSHLILATYGLLLKPNPSCRVF